MPAMRAEDRIVVREMRADTRRNGFLANIRVTRAEYESALMATRQFLFGLSNDLHRPIEGEERGFSQIAFCEVYICHLLFAIHYLSFFVNV